MNFKSVNYLFIGLSLLFFSCHKEQKIPINIDFDVTKVNNNNTIPVDVLISNATTGADFYSWTFEGGDPATSSLKNPGVIRFFQAGSHVIKLVASNSDFQEEKEVTINLDSMIMVDFTDSILVNDFAPATVRFTNNSVGGSSFAWTFDGGTPATSSLQNPTDVIFSTEGDHQVTLTVGNGSSTSSVTKVVTVAPPLAASFDIIPSFDDEDYQAPLTAQLRNTTVSGLTWQWTCPGGVISNPTADSPTIYFAAPGTYTVTLTANNIKSTQSVSHNIVVLPDANLSIQQDVKFGINTAHASIGCFYSTRLRKTFKGGDNIDTSGRWIDLAFFGLNSNFSLNKFITPDSSNYYTLGTIPLATRTKFINSQAACNCGVNFTATNFDNMVNGSALQSVTINPTPSGWNDFPLPPLNRIILFQTLDGRKGAIKIKEIVANGTTGSYILTDIKVQKHQ